MNSSALTPFKAPGNDSLGTNCLKGNALPGLGADSFPAHANVFVGGLEANGSYYPAAWPRCCLRGQATSLLNSCYPWCEIPAETLAMYKKDDHKTRVNHVGDAMREYLNVTGSSWVQLSAGYLAGPSLSKVQAAGMVLTYMLV